MDAAPHDTNAPLPPAPHDPRDRACVYAEDGWQVRTMPWNDPRHTRMIRHSTLHLQLWHPVTRTSVLTPSRLTHGRFEVQLPWRRVRFCCLKHLDESLQLEVGTTAPRPARVQYWTRWLVWAPAIGAIVGSQTSLLNPTGPTPR